MSNIMLLLVTAYAAAPVFMSAPLGGVNGQLCGECQPVGYTVPAGAREPWRAIRAQIWANGIAATQCHIADNQRVGGTGAYAIGISGIGPSSCIAKVPVGVK